MPKTERLPGRYTFPVNFTPRDRALMENIYTTYESVSRHAIVRAAIRAGLLREAEEPGYLGRYFSAACMPAVEAPEEPKEEPAQKEEPEPAKPLTEKEQIERDMKELGVGDPDVCNPFPID